MDTPEPPIIEFPCEDYPIRVMGDANAGLQDFVLAMFDKHAPGYNREKVGLRDSRNGNYESITVFITATGPEQLQQLFLELKADPRVKMVL